MLACHGEYTGARQKNSQHEFIKINLNHFEAYIVRPHDMIAEIMSTKEKYVRNIRNALALRMKNGVTEHNVQEVLDTMNWGFENYVFVYIALINRINTPQIILM